MPRPPEPASRGCADPRRANPSEPRLEAADAAIRSRRAGKAPTRASPAGTRPERTRQRLPHLQPLG